MEDRRPQIKVFNILIYLIMIIALWLGDGTANPICHNIVDIVFAVDTASSLTATAFVDVKTQVKAFARGFTIGQAHSRLALISISDRSKVIAYFNDVTTLSDFNAAVDRLTFYTGQSIRLSEAIKLANNAVLISERAKATKVLVLIKDRRTERTVDSSDLPHVASEAAALKNSRNAKINAVGIGGLWDPRELASLFGNQYLLLKNQNAFDSIKSLNNHVCEPPCPQKGLRTSKDELCYETRKHVTTYSVDLATNGIGDRVCRTKITKQFMSCTVKQSCNEKRSEVGPCDVSTRRVKIENFWQSFDSKLQTCITHKDTNLVDCADSMVCLNQVADVMFILDKSGSIGSEYAKVLDAARTLAASLSIGIYNVQTGLITYSRDSEEVIPFGSINEKDAFLRAINQLPISPGGSTYTNDALQMAEKSLITKGRKDVKKFAFLLTDGASSEAIKTMKAIDSIKKAGVTIFAIGIGNAVSDHELIAMTEPDSATNLYRLKDFDELKKWSKSFSHQMCLHLAAPHPIMCQESSFMQSITNCMLYFSNGVEERKRQVIRTSYKYDGSSKCIKSVNITDIMDCSITCTDPINGNEYLQGNTWSSGCYDFRCDNGVAKALKQRCLAADGFCRDAGAPPFRCRNEQGLEADNCICIGDNSSGYSGSFIAIDTV